jgi:hypothetical protein
MNVSRLLVTVLVVLTAMAGYAQDSYREALQQYLSYFGQDGKMKSAMLEMNESLFKQSGNVNLEELTERYFKEAFLDHLTDMSEAMMKERNVTEADLRTVIEMVDIPEGQTFLAHESEWQDKQGQMIDEYRTQFQDGGKPEKLKANPDIDAGYVAKFQEMWKNSGIEEKTLNLFNFSFSPGEMTGELAELGRIKTWLSDNLGTMSLNAAYGILTPEDLDFGMKLFANESFRKVTDTKDMNLFSVMGKSVDLILNYLDWMEAQGAQPNEKLNMLKGFMKMMDSGSDE